MTEWECAITKHGLRCWQCECQCNNREDLTSGQHERDCPLASSICVECWRGETCQMPDHPLPGSGHIKGNSSAFTIYDEAKGIKWSADGLDFPYEAEYMSGQVLMNAYETSPAVPTETELPLQDQGLWDFQNQAFRQLAAKMAVVCETLQMVHGHGPAKTEWKTDFENMQATGRVFMPFKEGCDICVAQRGVGQLREGNDG